MSEVERERPPTYPVDGAAAPPDLSRRYLALAAEAADRLLAATDPARMVDELFALIRAELRLDVFFNYRHDDGLLRLEAYAGLTAQQAQDGAELRLGEAVCGCAALERRRIHAEAVQRSDSPQLAFVRSIGLDCYACTPLLDGERLLGTLGFGRRDSPKPRSCNCSTRCVITSRSPSCGCATRRSCAATSPSAIACSPSSTTASATICRWRSESCATSCAAPSRCRRR